MYRRRMSKRTHEIVVLIEVYTHTFQLSCGDGGALIALVILSQFQVKISYHFLGVCAQLRVYMFARISYMYVLI